jgi:hypothetical protein
MYIEIVNKIPLGTPEPQINSRVMINQTASMTKERIEAGVKTKILLLETLEKEIGLMIELLRLHTIIETVKTSRGLTRANIIIINLLRHKDMIEIVELRVMETKEAGHLLVTMILTNKERVIEIAKMRESTLLKMTLSIMRNRMISNIENIVIKETEMISEGFIMAQITLLLTGYLVIRGEQVLRENRTLILINKARILI